MTQAHAHTHSSVKPENGLFLTDGGLETTLVFHEGIDLPCFAAFVLLDNAEGRNSLKHYFAPYLAAARSTGTGFLMDTPTWRANADWGEQLGYDRAALKRIQRTAVDFIADLRDAHGDSGLPILLNGVVGPRGDGYEADTAMDVEAARAYHQPQVDSFADTKTDQLTAVTMTNGAEAAGIARAAKLAGIRAAISFTVETDGRLPSGESLGDAVRLVESETDGAPAYYMVNCAHPDHFAHILAEGGPKLKGLRANASRMSHEELDAAETLDDGDPRELAGQYRDIRQAHSQLTVFGGCCGTDHRHICEMGRTLT